jgi:hypothetical protein
LLLHLSVFLTPLLLLLLLLLMLLLLMLLLLQCAASWTVTVSQTACLPWPTEPGTMAAPTPPLVRSAAAHGEHGVVACGRQGFAAIFELQTP